jgi:hypothetical protein
VCAVAQARVPGRIDTDASDDITMDYLCMVTDRDRSMMGGFARICRDE